MRATGRKMLTSGAGHGLHCEYDDGVRHYKTRTSTLHPVYMCMGTTVTEEK